MTGKKHAASRQVDEKLRQLFDLLFSKQGQLYGLQTLGNKDRFADAITGDLETDLWRSWRAAKQLMANSRPLEATERLRESGFEALPDQFSDRLVYLEIQVLISEITTSGNQVLAAYHAWQDTRQLLFKFVGRFESEPEAVKKELWRMLAVLQGMDAAGLDKQGDKALGKLGDEILSSWAVSRGISLLMDTLLNTVSMTKGSVGPEDAAKIAADAEQDIDNFCRLAGIQLDRTLQTDVEFFLGNLLTDIDPQTALAHFDRVVKWNNPESGVAIDAYYNSANCLVRLHRYAEAAYRYDAVESMFEMAGQRDKAAQVWMAGCIAHWRADGDPKIRHSLEGSIQFFMENIPEGADTRSLFTLKRFVEPGLQLLARILADDPNPGDDDLNELVSVLWTLLSRDYAVNLDAKPGAANKTSFAAWDEVLDYFNQSLISLKHMLQPYPGMALVHLINLPDRLEPEQAVKLPPNANLFGPAWFLLGYDRSGAFRYSVTVTKSEDATDLARFLEAIQDQLSADLLTDVVRVQKLEDELVRLADRIGARLSPDFRRALADVDHIFYMPHPFSMIGEFPLHGLRLDGEWLGAQRSITRVSTINQLREMLMPNNRAIQANRQAAIVIGNPETDGSRLVDTAAEANRVGQYLRYLGFETRSVDDAGRERMLEILAGEAGLVHYIGHGHATSAYEGLPLANDEFLQALSMNKMSSTRTPFVFICACEAARVRYGSGGYQIGVASKLLEKRAPGVLAFNFPIPEARAYRVAREFYAHGYRAPFGEALRRLRAGAGDIVPAFAWLSLIAYGDPDFSLQAISAGGHVSAVHERAATWVSKLCYFAVQRTEESRQAALQALENIADPSAAVARRLLPLAFQAPPVSSPELLDRLEQQVEIPLPQTAPGALIVRALILLERIHWIGIDERPMRYPQSPEETRNCFYNLIFVASASASLFEGLLNGLAAALLGRLLTWDQGNLNYSFRYLDQALDMFHEGGVYSPFLQQIIQDTRGVIEQFGGAVPG